MPATQTKLLDRLLGKLRLSHESPTDMQVENDPARKGTLPWPSSLDLSNLPPAPAGFLWGTATAGVQVEGQLPAADWALFTTSPLIRRRLRTVGRVFGLDVDPQPFGTAVRHFDAFSTDHLRFVREDLDRAQALGLNAYRFSVEWSRVQPTGSDNFDQDAVTYYQNVARAALERGMTPIVTLNHLSLPLWVLSPPQVGLLRLLLNPESDPAYRRRRGWHDCRTVDDFLAFVRIVVPALVEVGVRVFITFNEPVGTLIGVGYIAGLFPPGLLLAGKDAGRAYLNIVAAHRQTYDYIKKLPKGSETQVGIAPAILHVVPAEDPHGRVSARNRRAALQFDYFCNLHMLDALVFGQRSSSLDYRGAARAHQQAPNSRGMPAPQLDFIGVNYYRRIHVSHSLLIALAAHFAGGVPQDMQKSRARHGLLSEEGYEIFPAGLYFQLRRLHRRYEAAFAAQGRRLRFCVTENGLGESGDANRAPYLVAHVEQTLAAIRDGIDVFGYLYWSLMDNWEWISHYRPASRHGIFSVDRHRPELPRCMTDAGMALFHIVSAGGMGQARERFGTFNADGTAIQSPSMSAGRLYAGHLTTRDHNHRQDFELYLSARANRSPIGLLYYCPADKGVASDVWVTLVDLKVEHGRLTFRHNAKDEGRISKRVGGAAYSITFGADSLSIIGHATLGDDDWQLEGELQPLGLYTVPTTVPTAGLREDEAGTGTGTGAWAPLIVTRYQHNIGLSNARQLLTTWLHQDCPPDGSVVPVGGRIVLALLPSASRPRRRPPDSTPEQLIFTGTALVNLSRKTIFERAPDGVEF